MNCDPPTTHPAVTPHTSSTAGLFPLAGYLKRTALAVGNEKSLFTVNAIPFFNPHVGVSVGSTLIGDPNSKALKTVHSL